MSANLVLATGTGNMILPFVVDVYNATCKVGCQIHLIMPCQGVHIWIRLAWNACEVAAAFAAESMIHIPIAVACHGFLFLSTNHLWI